MTSLKPNLFCLLVFIVSLLGKSSAEDLSFLDDFSKTKTPAWKSFLDPGEWLIEGGFLTWTKSRNSVCLVPAEPSRDAVIQTTVRVGPKGRSCFGLVLRGRSPNTALVIRYYDQTDSLELLHFENHKIIRATNDRRRLHYRRDRAYAMKAAVVGDQLMAKLWPQGGPEPGWQFRTTVSDLLPGKVGLLAQDNTPVRYDQVEVWTEGGLLRTLQEELQRERALLEKRHRDSLKLILYPLPNSPAHGGEAVCRIDLALTSLEPRFAAGGKLEVRCGDYSRNSPLTASDFLNGRFRIKVDSPRETTPLLVRFTTGSGVELSAQIPLNPVTTSSWNEYVTRSLETLQEMGTDRYGPVQTPMLMAVLDVDSLLAPEKPDLYEAEVRTEGRPDHGRLSAGGTNAWLDQPLLRTMYLATEITGDRHYAAAADDYLRYFMEHCRKSNKMFVWGSHSYWHAFREGIAGDGVHEILIKHPVWEAMYRLNPKAVREEIDGIWEHHIQDKKTGRHNRHDSRGTGDFSFSAGSFTIAFAFMHKMTGEQHYLDKARLITEWHWSHRNPENGLVPESPWASDQKSVYWNGWHMFTQVTGCYGSQLLRASEICGDPLFRDRAIAYMKAYEKIGWNDKDRQYYAMLRVRDGKRIVEFNAAEGAHESPYTPIGYVDVWRTIMYTFEFPIVAAQAAVYAYESSDLGGGRKDPELLRIALHWAEVIEKNLPARLGRRFKDEVEELLPNGSKTGGTYAENYGRAISFYVHLHRATNEKKFLTLAEQIAGEAVEKLYLETRRPDAAGKQKRYGLFRTHPAKPYCQSNEGLGYLLHALLELGNPARSMPGAF